MKLNRSYQTALIAAVSLHVALLLAFFIQPKSERPVMQLEAKRETREAPQQEIVKAVSVNEQEVTAAIEKLKTERAAKERAEANRQRQLAKEAEDLRMRRVKEQQRLENLRAENARAEAQRKQAALEEQKRLQAMQKQKAVEAQKLEELKKQQIVLQKKQEEDLARQKAEEQRQLEAARVEKARLETENRARISGVVDRYKALILGAISQQWILPEQVNRGLSSQFRIRLAPNGSVLEVQLTRSSGDSILDRSAEAAIYKASPLPVPAEPEMFNLFREISLTVRPENVRG